MRADRCEQKDLVSKDTTCASEVAAEWIRQDEVYVSPRADAPHDKADDGHCTRRKRRGTPIQQAHLEWGPSDSDATGVESTAVKDRTTPAHAVPIQD